CSPASGTSCRGPPGCRCRGSRGPTRTCPSGGAAAPARVPGRRTPARTTPGPGRRAVARGWGKWNRTAQTAFPGTDQARATGRDAREQSAGAERLLARNYRQITCVRLLPVPAVHVPGGPHLSRPVDAGSDQSFSDRDTLRVVGQAEHAYVFGNDAHGVYNGVV